jgi:hypothetical protein
VQSVKRNRVVETREEGGGKETLDQVPHVNFMKYGKVESVLAECVFYFLEVIVRSHSSFPVKSSVFLFILAGSLGF